MSGLTIRRARYGDRDRLAALYAEAFAGRVGHLVHVRRAFDASTLVGTIGERVVGLACLAPADREVDRWLACLEPTTRVLLEPLGAMEPPTVAILAPPGLAPRRQRDDVVVSAIAVAPASQRRGIGRALALAQLEAARGRQVFVHAVEGSGSRPLYEGLGFTPLVHSARHYADGAGMTFLYRAIPR